MQLKKHILNEKGLGLLEVIAALGISSVVIVSLVSLSVFTLRTSLTGNLLLRGTKLANTELELVRALRDDRNSDWATFKLLLNGCNAPANCSIKMNCSLPTLIDSGSTTDTLSVCSTAKVVPGPSANPAENINVYFYKQDLGDSVIRVSVISSWKIGDETKYARLYSDFTDWRSR